MDKKSENVNAVVKSVRKFSPHELATVPWVELHRMTKQHQFRFDEIVKSQNMETTSDTVLKYRDTPDPNRQLVVPGLAEVYRKPSGYEVVDSKTGKRDVYPSLEQANRAVSLIGKEEELRQKEEAYTTYEEMLTMEEKLAKEEDSIVSRDLREKLRDARQKLKSHFPSAGKGTRTRPEMSIGEAGADRKQNPVRIA